MHNSIRYCHECGEEIQSKFSHCPFCGAKQVTFAESNNKDEKSKPEENNQNYQYRNGFDRTNRNRTVPPRPPKEKLSEKTWFIILLLIFFFPVGIYLMWKQKKFPKAVRIGVSAFFALAILINLAGGTSSNNTNNKNATSKPKQADNKVAKKKEEREDKEKEDLKITGKAEANINENGDIEVVLETNAIDSTLFEVIILDDNFNSVSEDLPVKNGKIEHTFTPNDQWGVGNLVLMITAYFDPEDSSQSDEINSVYGKDGNKLDGSLIDNFGDDGQLIRIKPVYIAFPNEESVIAAGEIKLAESLSEVKEISEGVIMDVKKIDENSDWRMVKVIVSDTWYNSEEYEKERAAEMLGEIAENLIRNCGLVKDDNIVTVDIYDSFGKQVAKPKFLGGYKIIS